MHDFHLFPLFPKLSYAINVLDSLQSLPEVLRPYAKAGEDIRHAAFHRIVVSTCSSAGMFHNIGIR